MDRVARKKEFIKAMAAMLGGTNQARMGIALAMPSGELKAVAELWRDVRWTVPGMVGYPTIEEAEKLLTEFLG